MLLCWFLSQQMEMSNTNVLYLTATMYIIEGKMEKRKAQLKCTVGTVNYVGSRLCKQDRVHNSVQIIQVREPGWFHSKNCNLYVLFDQDFSAPERVLRGWKGFD